MADQLSSNAAAGSFPVSVYDTFVKPQTIGKLIRRYGEGLYFMTFNKLAGKSIFVTKPDLKIIEEGAPERLVTSTLAVDTAPVTATAVTFDTGDGSKAYVREGFDLVIPPAYTNKDYPVNLRLYLDGTDWKATAYDETVAITATITAKEFALGASSWAKGGGQPKGMTDGFYERVTSERILAETIQWEADDIYKEMWEEVNDAYGGKGVLSYGTIKGDFRLDAQEEWAILNGELNTNAGLTGTSNLQGTKAIPSAEGLIPIMKTLAQELDWDASGFTIEKFEAIKPLLEAVGVTNREIDFFTGTNLNTSIYKTMRDYLVEFSPGHSLYNGMDMGEVGFDVNKVRANGVITNIINIPSFSNPNKMGGEEYPYSYMGFMFPQGEHKVTINDNGADKSFSLPHLTLAYPQGNGQTRKRIVTPSPGVTGLSAYPMAVNQWSQLEIFMKTHMIPIWTYMQQTILVNSDQTTGSV